MISTGAMKQLGVVLDLAGGKVEFRKLNAAVPVRGRPRRGLCGFDINVEASQKRQQARTGDHDDFHENQAVSRRSSSRGRE